MNINQEKKEERADDSVILALGNVEVAHNRMTNMVMMARVLPLMGDGSR